MRTGAFLNPLWGSSSLRRGRSPRVLPARALFLKKRLSPQRRSAWNSCRLIPMRKAGLPGRRRPQAGPRPRRSFFLQPRLFCGQGTAQLRPAGQNRALFPPAFPRPFPFSCSPPLFSRCKKPARQVFSDRPGWLFVLFHLLRAPPCGDAVWINAAADSAPRNRRRSPRRWAAPIRRGSYPGCACRRYVRPPCCPPPGAGRPTAPARRWR